MTSETKTIETLTEVLGELRQRNAGRGARPRSLAITKIEEAVHWLREIDLSDHGTATQKDH